MKVLNFLILEIFWIFSEFLMNFKQIFQEFFELKIEFLDFYKCASDVAQSGAFDQIGINDQGGR